ncbi:hypothetical protein PEC18_29775 [Paucibacter sp. O1-1]|nr:hypothetical protein [Paucibacter sp. O1-1]MDA3829924.1 hypothetical protein [Paucibacter sp. O1-1]
MERDGVVLGLPDRRSCLNEDRANLNGRLDAGEDTNGDGVPTPGNLVALLASTVTTDANGVATITMRYAEHRLLDGRTSLTATAIVAGTESVTYKDFPLDKLSGDYSAKTVSPAGANSPFGVDTSACSSPNPSIALVGMPGSGKSTVGRQLARHLDRRFFDSDRRDRAADWLPDPAVLRAAGRGGLSRCRAARGGRPARASAAWCWGCTGGGTVLREANRRALAEHCVVVYLRSSPEELSLPPAPRHAAAAAAA